ncbi:MAG: C25 family cysteine peptidase, partial [Candidatus Cloacimonetes bacterium]|nr:C25 family cysteine peptidase [Candidatus Cloacimonadota bacterium]
MHKIFVLLTLLFITGLCFGLVSTINFDDQAENIAVLNVTNNGLVLDLAVPNIIFSELEIENRIFTEMNISGFGKKQDVGEPELPYLSRLISVPLEANINIYYRSEKSREISLPDFGFTQPVYPAQPSYAKNQDLSQIIFQYSEAVYQTADYQTNFSPFAVQEVGFLRGHRLFEVVYTPVRYNPVEKSLVIYENLVVELTFEGSNTVATDYLQAKTWSADFEKIYQAMILNYTPQRNRDVIERFPTKYLIICHTPFIAEMQPFVEWKSQQGFDVSIVGTDVTGTSTTSIKEYIQAIWDAASPNDPAPSYLLLVGDTAQIPVWSYSNNLADTNTVITDNTYAVLQGSGNIPDMYYGRFSAQTIAQLTPQIEKTIMYEKMTMPDISYLGRAHLIAEYDN